MRPEDHDIIARVIAQKVSAVAAKYEAKAAPFDPTDLIARLDALEAENKALREAAVLRDDLDAIQGRVDAQSKAIIDMKSDESVATLVKETTSLAEEVATMADTFKSFAERIGKSDKAFDNHLKDLIGRIKELESVEPETVNLDVIADQVLGQVKALIPAEADEDAVVKRVINHVDKVLPDMIPTPTPVDVDALRLSISKDLPQREAIIKDIQKLVNETMPKALAPTDLQVIEAVKAVYPSIRQDLVKRLPAMEHKGVWNPDTSYDVGDEVIKNGSTYRLMEPSTDAPPSDAWQMVAQGSRGKQGKPGVAPTVDQVVKAIMSDPEIVKRLKGKDGVGVKEITMEGKTFLFEMTDGDVKTLDQTEFVELIIKAIGE